MSCIKAPDGTEQGKTTEDKRQSRHQNNIKKCLKFFEVFILLSVEFVVAGLFLIPTVYYALPDVVKQQDSAPANLHCTEVVPYSKSACISELKTVQACFSGLASSPQELNIPSTIDQQQGEREILNFFAGLKLPFLDVSLECMEGVKPFLCLQVFPLCDANGNLHLPQQEECSRLRDSLCSSAWIQAEASLPPGTLPECEKLSNTANGCSVDSLDKVLSIPRNQPSDKPLNCSKGFFFDMNETGLCRPECGEFLAIGLGLLAFERLSIVVSIIAAIVMFILALTVQKDKLLAFPQILVVYICGTVLVFGTSLIIGFVENAKLFCGSRDQIYAVGRGNETVYCTFTGVITTYFLEQICVWTALHSIFLFWAIGFPFSYRQLNLSGRMHYAHGIGVILALLLPLPGALIPLKDGFYLFRNPTLGCIGRNYQFVYYLTVLPISILLWITSGALVLTFWKIFREFILKKLIAGKKVSEVGKAEIKIAMILVYYTFVGVMGLVSFTVSDHQDHIIADRIIELIVCESTGTEVCDTINMDTQRSIEILSIVSIVMTSYLPVVAVLFSCDPKVCRRQTKK